MSRQGKRGPREAKSRPAGDSESREGSARKDRRARLASKLGDKDDDDADEVKERPRGHSRGRSRGKPQRSSSPGDDEEDYQSPRRLGDKKAMPAIFKAIAEDDLAEVESELDHLGPGALPPIYKGCSPLSFAAKLGSVKMVKFLLQKGAPIDGGDFVSMTPLHQSVKGKHEDVVVALLTAGANIRALSRQGKTPWEYARDDEMKAILRTHGSKSLQSPRSPPASSNSNNNDRRRRSFDGRDDPRGPRSESWSGPRLKSSNHHNNHRSGGGSKEKSESSEHISGHRDKQEHHHSHRRPMGSGDHKSERSESRARRERQRKKKGEPRKPRPEGRKKHDSDDESGGLNDSIVGLPPDNLEEDRDKDIKEIPFRAQDAKGSHSPKTAESLENELLALLKEEQEQVLKMENRIVELKAETQKVTGQLKSYKLSVSEKKKYLLKGIASLKAAAASPPPPPPKSPSSLKRIPSAGTSSECVICLENTANCLIAPCGHICLCTECKTTNQPKNCPICRGDIQGIFQAFRV